MKCNIILKYNEIFSKDLIHRTGILFKKWLLKRSVTILLYNEIVYREIFPRLTAFDFLLEIYKTF